jgi:hypothetical protein
MLRNRILILYIVSILCFQGQGTKHFVILICARSDHICKGEEKLTDQILGCQKITYPEPVLWIRITFMQIRMRIRIRLITLMRIRIRFFFLQMRIRLFTCSECGSKPLKKRAQIGSNSISVHFGWSSANSCGSGFGLGSSLSYRTDADLDADFYFIRMRIRVFI